MYKVSDIFKELSFMEKLFTNNTSYGYLVQNSPRYQESPLCVKKAVDRLYSHWRYDNGHTPGAAMAFAQLYALKTGN